MVMLRSIAISLVALAWTPSTAIESTKLPLPSIMSSSRNNPKVLLSAKEEEKSNEESYDFSCDYLVVGAGTSGMSFVDTLLTHNPNATIILIDKNAQPGGHWVHAYPFCRLHQPSCFYGVDSMPLGKKFCKSRRKRKQLYETYDVDDRATRDEILEYYSRLRNKFEATGRVDCLFNVEYKGKAVNDSEDGQEEMRLHKITVPNNDGNNGNDQTVTKLVKCHKLVTVANPVTVPSMRRTPSFSVDPSTPLVPINDLPSCVSSGKYSKYLILGNGKTGCDAIGYLLEQANISPANIQWIVSRDAWYILRDSLRDFWGSFVTFDHGYREVSVENCFLRYEREGFMGRLDPTSRPIPKIFKAAILSKFELKKLRSITNVARMGRVMSIESNEVVCQHGKLALDDPNTLVVDCTMAKDNHMIDLDENFEIFQPHHITLGPFLSFYNPSGSAARIAFVECAFGEENDDKKNKVCFFVRGQDYTKPTIDYFVGMTYMEAKSIEALNNVPGGMKWYLGSRTFSESLRHHPQHSKFRGMIRLLWLLYGPPRLVNFQKRLCHKVESKGFNDVDHCWGIETL